MKTMQDLKQFYSTTLLNTLTVLEKKRKRTVWKLVFISVALLGVIAVLFSWVKPSLDETLGPLATLFVLGFLSWLLAYEMLKKSYAKKYKVEIIPKVVDFIDENLSYSMNAYIPQATYLASDIFRQGEFYKNKPFTLKRRIGYSGGNLVSGKIGSAQIEFSEIEETIGAHQGKSTIFEGLFFTVEFNKNFACKTVIVPKGVDDFLGPAGKKIIHPWNKRNDPFIKLDYPEFEELFAVYANNLIHPRYILSVEIMRKIINFKKMTGRLFYLSFVNSKLFVAIEYYRKFLVPRLFGTVLDCAIIQSYFEDIQFVTGLVDELNSNTLAWSME
jgi:hypothetical protein